MNIPVQNNTKPILYQEELQSFLRIFAKRTSKEGLDKDGRRTQRKLDMDDIVYVEKDVFRNLVVSPESNEEFGRFHPVQIAKKLLDKRFPGDADKDNKEQLIKVLSAAFPYDHVTGFYAKQCMPVIVGLAHLNAQTGNTPVCLIEGDFCNMGGCNDAITKGGTDKLIHEICKILKDSFTQYAKQQGLPVETHGIRAGGDEIRMVAYGLNKEQVDEVLKKSVHPQIQLLAMKFGVHSIKHSKQGKMPGFGAAFASVDLGAGHSEETVRHNLNVGIETEKDTQGYLRLGMTDTSGVDRYIDKVYRPYLKAHKSECDIDGVVAEKRKTLNKIARELNTQWLEMSAGTQGYPVEFHDNGFDNPYKFFINRMTRNPEDIQEELQKIEIKPPVSYELPFEHKIVNTHDEPLEATHMRYALRAFGFGNIVDKLPADNKDWFKWVAEKRHYKIEATKEQKELSKTYPDRSRWLRMVMDTMQYVNSPDPASRCKAPHLMLEDAQTVVRRKNGAQVLHLELSNINGLNAISYDLADAALRETGKFIQEAVGKHGAGWPNIAEHIYHEGGGKFKVFLPGSFKHEDVKLIASEVQKSVDSKIASKTLLGFARSTYAHFGQDPHNPRPGSQEKYAAIENRLKEYNQTASKAITYMDEIPHPKVRHRRIGIKSKIKFIAKDDNVEAELLKLSRDAEMEFGSGEHRALTNTMY